MAKIPIQASPSAVSSNYGQAQRVNTGGSMNLSQFKVRKGIFGKYEQPKFKEVDNTAGIIAQGLQSFGQTANNISKTLSVYEQKKQKSIDDGVSYAAKNRILETQAKLSAQVDSIENYDTLSDYQKSWGDQFNSEIFEGLEIDRLSPQVRQNLDEYLGHKKNELGIVIDSKVDRKLTQRMGNYLNQGFNDAIKMGNAKEAKDIANKLFENGHLKNGIADRDEMIDGIKPAIALSKSNHIAENAPAKEVERLNERTESGAFKNYTELDPKQRDQANNFAQKKLREMQQVTHDEGLMMLMKDVPPEQILQWATQKVSAGQITPANYAVYKKAAENAKQPIPFDQDLYNRAEEVLNKFERGEANIEELNAAEILVNSMSKGSNGEKTSVGQNYSLRVKELLNPDENKESSDHRLKVGLDLLKSNYDTGIYGKTSYKSMGIDIESLQDKASFTEGEDKLSAQIELNKAEFKLKQNNEQAAIMRARDEDALRKYLNDNKNASLEDTVSYMTNLRKPEKDREGYNLIHKNGEMFNRKDTSPEDQEAVSRLQEIANQLMNK